MKEVSNIQFLDFVILLFNAVSDEVGFILFFLKAYWGFVGVLFYFFIGWLNGVLGLLFTYLSICLVFFYYICYSSSY